MKLIWCEKSKGGKKFLTEESWNGDGNGDVRGCTIKSSLFETLGFTNYYLFIFKHKCFFFIFLF